MEPPKSVLPKSHACAQLMLNWLLVFVSRCLKIFMIRDGTLIIELVVIFVCVWFNGTLALFRLLVPRKFGIKQITRI